MPTLDEQLDKLTARIASLESVLAHFVQNTPGKEWYTTAEVARLLGRAEWTVREWCRNGRVHATKRATGRGRHKEWSIRELSTGSYARPSDSTTCTLALCRWSVKYGSPFTASRLL